MSLHVAMHCLLFSIFFRTVLAGTWPCPLAADITPCICSSDPDYYMDLNCDDVVSDSELQLALSPDMPFSDYRQLNIAKDGTGINLNILTYDTFNELSFQSIDIHDTTLQQVFDGAFQSSQETLQNLKLDHNNINSFSFGVLSLYNSLTSLTLSYNALPKIDKLTSDSLTFLDLSYNLGATIDVQTFNACKKLEFLDLSAIGLKDIPENIFSMNPLRELRLSGNELTTLRPNAINSALSFTQLYLENNAITQIDVGSIQNLNSICYLHMANNDIKDLFKENWSYIFNTLANSGSIDLAGNGLTCGCEMEWLFTDTPPLVFKLTDETKCHDGKQVNTIDPNVMISLCSN